MAVRFLLALAFATIPFRVAAAGGLANVDRLSVEKFGPSLITLTHPEAVVVAPDGAFVYVANNSPDAVVVLGRDAGTGRLSPLSWVYSPVFTLNGAQDVLGLALSPLADHLYTASRWGVGAFARDAGTGALALVEWEGEVEPDAVRLADLAVSPDGDNLYAVSPQDDTVKVFARDGLTGALSPVQTVEDGVGGVSGLNGASGVVVSPDGANVYVAAGGDSLAAFERDSTTGALVFLTSYADSNALNRANDLAISPDGKHLYVATAPSTGGPTVYGRDPITGLLTLIEVGPPGETVVFRRSLTGVTISADGSKVVASGNSTSLFERDPVTGHLTFLGAESGRGERVRMSPDGLHVYAATSGSDLGIYRLLTFGCAPAAQMGCKAATLPRKSRVLIRRGSDPTGDRFRWNWVRGQATSLEDFGDPVNALDDVVVCLYDASGSPQPVFEATAPAGGICDDRPCWETRGSTPGRRKLRYNDPLERPDGLAKWEAKEGLEGAARIKVKGKDQFIIMPTLPFTLPVTIQVQSAAGGCWQAVYGTADVNDTEQFRAKND